MTWSVAWNWKSALASSLCRAAIFFAINLSAGMDAAVAAMQVEFASRAVASGFYGSLTQYFARHHGARGVAATLIVPGLAHLVEFGVHRWAATPVLGWSVVGSVAFSMLTTRFTLFAMRQGVFTVGHGSASWWQDMRALPALVLAFFRVPSSGAPV
jgi:hypothetical protein